MKPTIEIDSDSGFCFGVVTAIRKAEEQLLSGGSLYCLGDIVHNSNEVERLRTKGLHTITHDDLLSLKDVKVLLRAHGEPPSTYLLAKERGIEIIDATCPVVLQLQKRIKSAWETARNSENPPLILIYGKPGHAEVNGLVGQTDGNAVVIQTKDDLAALDLNRDVLLYSQTTKSLNGFQEIIDEIKNRKTEGEFHYFDTICRRVAGRIPKIREFAANHEVIIFVSGRKSSNGKALFEECKRVNPRTYFITEPSEIKPEMLSKATSIGICGATSTPRWLMEAVRNHIDNAF
ncbi:MAG: 4-hydroxy-3-methylbut-2-enyl diphosphate reductase [Prevotella sp.]|nr:4-hydroxy-3-methylbut-2-enyl diphosphate reductase [Prevotella sp.]MCM1074809.1 4-hydroxy-3-methylbut-2-enyl diphosphate reductase [Ruminococcus sp.]